MQKVTVAAITMVYTHIMMNCKSVGGFAPVKWAKILLKHLHSETSSFTGEN